MFATQYTPYTIPLLLSAFIAAGLAFFVSRQPRKVGVFPFIVLMLGVTEWSLAYVGELVFVNFAVKVVFGSITYLGITTVPAAWLAFALEYTGNEKWITRRNIALLFIEPLLAIAAAWTNMAHHLFWSTQVLQMVGPTAILVTTSGIGFWIHAVYSYLLLLAGVIALIRAFVRSPSVYRGQAATLLIGAFIPWIANFLYVTGLNPFPNLDLTPISFALMGLMLALSIMGFRLLDNTPVARDQVFESIQDGVLVLDMQNRIIDINPAALHIIGLNSASQILGKPIAQALPNLGDLIAQYRNIQQTNAEIVIPAGTRQRHFQLSISPVKNRRGSLLGRLYVVHEISELKEAAAQIEIQNAALTRANTELAVTQKQAEEASRLKSEFLATISHELRTPLNSIIGYTDLLLTGLAGDLSEKQKSYLQRVVGNGERLLGLINDVLDIAKIEAARLDIESIVYTPRDLLQRTDGQLRTLADQKGLSFSTELDPNLPTQLKGDPKRIEQILINLIGNAIRYTDSGSITARFAKADGSQWSLTVTDTGVGIPPHALDFIFDEFRQVDGSTTREHGGTGLGLAIVRKLTTLMGGVVRVQSEVGKGSTFTVWLPLVSVDAPIVEMPLVAFGGE